MNTKVIAAMNQKGGVGKTLTTTLLAEWFALVRHKRVLLIDLDMQCNTTDQWVGMEAHEDSSIQLPPIHSEYSNDLNVNERSTIADIFYGLSVLPYTTWLNYNLTQKGFVDLLCGHPEKLEEVNNEFSRHDDKIDKAVHNRIREFLFQDEVQNAYDIILLDTGPSRNPIFRAAMRAATHIIIPFKPEEKDIQGIVAMLQNIKQENYLRSNANKQLELIGLLPNMVKHTNLHKNNLDTLHSMHPDIIFPKDSFLMNLTAFPERDIKNCRPKSIFELKDSSPARAQATSMAKFVEAKAN